MVLCTSLPVAWLWQSENWSVPHPPAQGSHCCPASHKSLSPDRATASVHLTPPSPCQTLPVAAVPVLCHWPLQNVTATPSTMLQGAKAPPIIAPTGGLCLLEVPPLQSHHFKGGRTQGRKHGGRASRAWPSSVTPENTRYRSTQHSCCGRQRLLPRNPALDGMVGLES